MFNYSRLSPVFIKILLNMRSLLLLGFIFLSSLGYCQGQWELKNDEDGIKVFVRDQQNSNLKEIKVLAKFNSTLPAMVLALADKDRMDEWIFKCKVSRTLKNISANESYHYQITDAPWPVDDRDLVIHTIVKQNPTSKVVEIEAKGVPDYVERKKGLVRVPAYYAHWVLTPINQDQLEIEYILRIDPGGILPAWVINLAVSDGPMETMKKLSSFVKNYESKKVGFVKE